MIREPGQAVPLHTSTSAPHQLSDAEMHTIVAGTGKQTAKAEAPTEQITFQYGALALRY
jgi:hypothetical protein